MELKKIVMTLVGVLFLSPSFLRADDTSSNISIGKMISNLKISGDMRVRQENFWYATPGKVDRSRQRFRFRLGIEPQIQDIKIGFRLASGTGEQVSTNQSLDNGFIQKGIFIDQAYLQWKAFNWLSVTGGKMPNLIWRTYASDIMWDDDINPEGFTEQLNYKFNEYLNVFSNSSQLVLDEDGSDNRDQWVFAQQFGTNVKIYKDTKANFGLTYYHFLNETKSNLGIETNAGGFGTGVIQTGNSRGAGNVLVATFSVIHLTTEFQTKVFSLPLSVQADYLKNLAPNGGLGSISSEQSAYQLGAILGKASQAMTWEVAYFFKWEEANATLSDFVDSDFGSGGTNRRGHIFWVAFSPRDYLTLKAKFFSVETIKPVFSPENESVNRMQLDVSVKF